MTSPAAAIPFVTAHACGNDFILIDAQHASADLAGLTRRICDRHRGVGADGVEWLFPDPDADICARLLNADGSEAEISGNGTRCVAAHLVAGNNREKITIRTGAGLKTCTLTRRADPEFEFEIAMGEPDVGDALLLQLASGNIRGIPVSMGNPHYVVFVNEFAPGWQAAAAEIGRHPAFEHGVNIELVRVSNQQEIEARFFERGVGETQSSGTGSCASAVASIASHRAESPVRVHTPGGVQTVRWQQEVFLRGPARLLCRGEFFI
jgi:diaminopimelate epimerase